VFFFIVGNELKQELMHGELRDPRRAALLAVNGSQRDGVKVGAIGAPMRIGACGRLSTVR
jgi:Na+/H+ antiporter NhaA